MNLRASSDDKRTSWKFARTLVAYDQNGLLYAYSESVVSDQYDVRGITVSLTGWIFNWHADGTKSMRRAYWTHFKSMVANLFNPKSLSIRLLNDYRRICCYKWKVFIWNKFTVRIELSDLSERLKYDTFDRQQFCKRRFLYLAFLLLKNVY